MPDVGILAASGAWAGPRGVTGGSPGPAPMRAPTPVLVAVLANMAESALAAGHDRPGQDRPELPGPGSGDLRPAVQPGPSPRAHRVDRPPVRAGRAGGRAGLGPRPGRGDRHRSGRLGPLHRGPRRVPW